MKKIVGVSLQIIVPSLPITFQSIPGMTGYIRNIGGWPTKFNAFVDEFVNRLAYLDSDFDPESSEGFLEFVVQQKIDYGN